MINIGSTLRPLVRGVTLFAGSAFAQAPNPTPTPVAPLDSVQGVIRRGVPTPIGALHRWYDWSKRGQRV